MQLAGAKGWRLEYTCWEPKWKSRLEGTIPEYLDAAGLREAAKDTMFFQNAIQKTNLSATAIACQTMSAACRCSISSTGLVQEADHGRMVPAATHAEPRDKKHADDIARIPTEAALAV